MSLLIVLVVLVVVTLVPIMIGGWMMSGILGTTFWRAIGVAIIAVAIQIAIGFFFVGLAVSGA